MNKEEKKYTETEWKWKQINDNFISEIRRVFIGKRIRTKEVLDVVMYEIEMVTDPKVFKEYFPQ